MRHFRRFSVWTGSRSESCPPRMTCGGWDWRTPPWSTPSVRRTRSTTPAAARRSPSRGHRQPDRLGGAGRPAGAGLPGGAGAAAGRRYHPGGGKAPGRDSPAASCRRRAVNTCIQKAPGRWPGACALRGVRAARGARCRRRAAARCTVRPDCRR